MSSGFFVLGKRGKVARGKVGDGSVPSDISLSDFKRWFQRHGVIFEPGGRHLKMRGIVKGAEVVYPLATLRGRYVKHCYLKAARKRFCLTEDDGYPDKDFCD